MSKEIVLDIETDGLLGGPNDPKPKITLIGVYFYENDEFRCFTEHELHELWPRLEKADRIIGYNTKGFDYPVMNLYYTGDFMKFPSLDLLEAISGTLGFRVKLDDVAQATLGVGKTGHGRQAIEFYRKGEMDKLRDYCLMDVKVTKEVYEYGKANGQVHFCDRTGQKRAVPIDFKPREIGGQGINLTLGF